MEPRGRRRSQALPAWALLKLATRQMTASLHTGSATTLLGMLVFTVPAGTEPTPEALRTLQIKGSYAGLLDLSPGGGFGGEFGTLRSEANKGVEYVGVADDGTGRVNVTLAIQIPSHFNPGKPCIVAAPSSGSRGIYGAAPTTGEWSLNKGCAVAYTDKGTGVGAHDLDADRTYAINGTLTSAGERKDLTFNANLTQANIGPYRN